MEHRFYFYFSSITHTSTTLGIRNTYAKRSRNTYTERSRNTYTERSRNTYAERSRNTYTERSRGTPINYSVSEVSLSLSSASLSDPPYPLMKRMKFNFNEITIPSPTMDPNFLIILRSISFERPDLSISFLP